MPYRELTGNLFASMAQARIRAVNYFSLMGKDLALTFQSLFSEMFVSFKKSPNYRKFAHQ